MCQGVKVLAMFIILVETKSESTEEFFAPSTIVFKDIYNSQPASTEDIAYTSTTETEDYRIDSKPQFVEFHPLVTEKQTVPPPRYIFDAKTIKENKLITTTTTTTEDPDSVIKVVPIKKHYQRGLLDLLLPPKRVKTFKNVFDSIRRVLSHTFKR